MAKKSFSAGINETIGTAEKFITGLQIIEEKQKIDEQEIAQMKIDTEPQKTAETAESAAKTSARKKRKDAPENRKTERRSILLTESQAEALDRIAYVKHISVNELIGDFVNDGIKKNREDLKIWDAMNEVKGKKVKK